MVKLSIEIVYIPEDGEQFLVSRELDCGATVQDAIIASGVLSEFTELDLTQQRVGVYSQAVSMDTPLIHNDRVELYRLLKIDPKQKRRMRAQS